MEERDRNLEALVQEMAQMEKNTSKWKQELAAATQALEQAPKQWEFDRAKKVLSVPRTVELRGPLVVPCALSLSSSPGRCPANAHPVHTVFWQEGGQPVREHLTRCAPVRTRRGTSGAGVWGSGLLTLLFPPREAGPPELTCTGHLGGVGGVPGDQIKASLGPPASERALLRCADRPVVGLPIRRKWGGGATQEAACYVSTYAHPLGRGAVWKGWGQLVKETGPVLHEFDATGPCSGLPLRDVGGQ